MAGSAAFKLRAGNSDHVGAAHCTDEPAPYRQAPRRRPASGLLRPSQVPVRGDATRLAGSLSPSWPTHHWPQLRRASGASAGPAVPLTRPSAVPARLVRDLLPGPGQPLATPLKEEMEGRLGADFSDVRVHTGAAARASAAEFGACAYTCGSHIVIGDGGADKHTLAHELTHVIQQREGPVADAGNGGGLKISSPGDRFEQQAETSAQRALSGPSLPHTAQLQPVTGNSAVAQLPRPGPAAPLVQRSNGKKGKKGKKDGEFIGDPEAIHLHIGIGKPHLKLGGHGPRHDIEGDDFGGYSFSRCARALDELTQVDRRNVSGGPACRAWLEDMLNDETIPGAGKESAVGSEWGQGLIYAYPARPFRKAQ